MLLKFKINSEEVTVEDQQQNQGNNYSQIEQQVKKGFVKDIHDSLL